MSALKNMKDVQAFLNRALLPKLAASGWEGKGITKLHKSRSGLDIWTVIFGWPPGYGPAGALSIDAGCVPELVGWESEREAALKLLCNGWDPGGLTYHVPTCWYRRFPDRPIVYRGSPGEALAVELQAVFRDVEKWARARKAAELATLADQLAALKGPEHVGARKWARNYRTVLERTERQGQRKPGNRLNRDPARRAISLAARRVRG